MPTRNNQPVFDVAFDGQITTPDTTSPTNGRGGGGGEPNSPRVIASLGRNKIRFDGQYLHIPNTKEGQRLAELITGARQRRRGSWIVIHAGEMFSEIEALHTIFGAMKQAIQPSKPAQYEDTRRALMKHGVRGGIVNELAMERWITPGIIESWYQHLISENPPNSVTGVLISSLKAGLVPPNHEGSHYRETFKRLDPVRWDGGSGVISSFYKDGLRAEVVDDTGEPISIALAELTLIEIASEASI